MIDKSTNTLSMKSNFTRTLFLSFSLSLLLLIITSIASYVSITNLLSSTGWVNHTHVVIQKVETILSTLKDAETGQRGYLLTGDAEFLEPYNGAYEKVVILIDGLKETVSDNPSQVANADVLKDIVVKRLASLQNIIDIKRTNG